MQLLTVAELLSLASIHLESRQVRAHLFRLQLLAELEPCHQVSDGNSLCAFACDSTQHIQVQRGVDALCSSQVFYDDYPASLAVTLT